MLLCCRVAEVCDAVQSLRLQQPTPQEDEMEDVRWFSRCVCVCMCVCVSAKQLITSSSESLADGIDALSHTRPVLLRMLGACLRREWVQAALDSGQDAAPSGFCIPGEYSLAHRLITGWLGGAGSSSSDGRSSDGSSSSSWVGDWVPQVEIDQGVFKYVLLRLSDPRDSRKSKLLVRGHAAAAYHNHILQATKAEVQRAVPGGQHFDVQVLGGGRIEHYPEQQVVSVYGYSAAFGPAVHEVAAGLLKKWLPFHNVTWSYAGY